MVKRHTNKVVGVTASLERDYPLPGSRNDSRQAEDCRAKEAQLRAVAELLADPTYRARALQMADRWAALAAEYEAESQGHLQRVG